LVGLRPGARVLDAACGIGIDAAALRRRGFEVTGTDASASMVAAARQRLGTDTDVRVHRCGWADLPGRFSSGSFDAVLCTGNSIAHAADEATMVSALRGFRAVLEPDGRLVVDSHDWEGVHAGAGAFVEDPTVVTREGVSCRRSYRWTIPDRFDAPHVLAITLSFTEGDQRWSRTHHLALHPFTPDQLRGRMVAAGFRTPTMDDDLGEDRYTAVAVTP
jgi:SAM-dependent methyltransferase